MSQIRAKSDPLRPAAWPLGLLALCASVALAGFAPPSQTKGDGPAQGQAKGPNPCAAWTLPMTRDPANPEALRIQLEHRGDPQPGSDWTFYALVLPESATAAAPPLTVARLVSGRPKPIPLAPVRLDGHARLSYVVADWYRYNPDRPWGLYLVRLPAPEPRLTDLGLAVEPYRPGLPPPGTAEKFHGELPPRVLELEPGSAEGLGSGALVCKARSPAQ